MKLVSCLMSGKPIGSLYNVLIEKMKNSTPPHLQKAYHIGILLGQFGSDSEAEPLIGQMRGKAGIHAHVSCLPLLEIYSHCQHQCSVQHANEKPDQVNLSSPNPFQLWAVEFHRRYLTHQFDVLLGYSLGGRLLLQVLNYFPEMAKTYCFVSTNPGLDSQSEKQDRLVADRSWIENFRYQPWEKAWDLWNAQAPFGPQSQSQAQAQAHAKANASGQEKAFTTTELSTWLECLEAFSLGKQDNMESVIELRQRSIQWVCGKNDLKFANIGRRLKENYPAIQYHEFKNTWHRVHIERPEELADLLMP